MAKRRAAKKAAKRKGAAKKKGATKASKRGPSAAFMEPMVPSEALAKVVGAKPLPRTEVTKRLWAYIKKNKLQDKANRRLILADETLKGVFGGAGKVDMFKMTKLVNLQLEHGAGGGH